MFCEMKRPSRHLCDIHGLCLCCDRPLVKVHFVHNQKGTFSSFLTFLGSLNSPASQYPDEWKKLQTLLLHESDETNRQSMSTENLSRIISLSQQQNIVAHDFYKEERTKTLTNQSTVPLDCGCFSTVSSWSSTKTTTSISSLQCPLLSS